MNDLRQVHRYAMELVEMADLNMPDVERIRRIAMYLETIAAEELRGEYDAEPSRSVLYRSAASLAYQCRELEQAEELIKVGLNGNPPAEIRAELEELRGQVAKAMEGYQ